MSYELNFEMFRSLKNCIGFVVNCDADAGEISYGIQGKLQMACIGTPHVQDNDGNVLYGPTVALFRINPTRMNYITDLHDAGYFEEAASEMISFGLQEKVIHFRDEDLLLTREFQRIKRKESA